MIHFFNSIDTSVFLFLNSKHSPLLDSIMLSLSYNKILFGIILLGLCVYGFIKLKKIFFIAFLFCLVGFGLSDSISSRVFKQNFKRLRPCHNEVLKSKVYLAGEKCWGGKFGFVSSHAANSFAIAMFFWLLFKVYSKKFSLLFLYSASVSYSRIYLAKHYPGDIIFGALLGILCGYIAYKLFTLTRHRLKRLHLNQ